MNWFRGIDFAMLESIPGLLKRSTNTGCSRLPRFPGGQERNGGSGTAGTPSSERRAIHGNRRLRYPRGRRPTAVVGGKLSPSLSSPRSMSGAGSPLLHLRPSAPSATFVSRVRICKPFWRSPGIYSQPGRIDSSESIPELLKRLQIRALLEGRRFRLLTEQSPYL